MSEMSGIGSTGGMFGAASGSPRGSTQPPTFGRGLTGTASAGLKIEVPGLQAFKTEIGKVREGIEALRKAFVELAKAPKDFVTALEKANQQLVSMNKNIGATKNLSPAFGKSAGSVSAGGPPGAGGGPGGGPTAAGGTGGMSAAAGVAAGANDIGAFITQASQAYFGRFQSGKEAAVGADMYLSRMAPSAGRTGRGMAQGLGTGLPFRGSYQDVSETMYNLSQQGYVVGAADRNSLGGRRGLAAVQSINTLQALAPGLAPQEAGAIVQRQASNVSAQRQGVAVVGQAAMAYTRGGDLKPLDVRFKEMLLSLQQKQGGGKSGKPFTKDQLIASQVPGSTLSTYLSQVGWDEQMIGMFYSWAIAQAVAGPGFTGTDEKQMEQVRGKSLAAGAQELETKKGTADARFAGDQYKNMLSQQDRDKQMVGLLSSIDHTLKGMYGVAGKLPTGWGGKLGGLVGGTISKVISGATSAATGGASGGAGDPPGLSQLNPDVKGRVANMMEANPNLKVVSGYRTNQQQRRMWESGNPFMAPPGKSHHGRGAAADLGPSSQYGWIKKNAKRFGLDHAAGMGEPWHVQLSGTMFGIGDISSSERDEWLARSTQSQSQAEMQHLQNQFTQAMAGGGAAGAVQSGVDTAASAISSALADAGTTGASAGGGTGPMTGKVPLETVVKALYAAGFRGDDLINMAAIPSRESGYRADATNLSTKTKDQSYGLWQINVRQDANYATAKKVLGSEDWTQLYDPYQSAKVAFEMYSRSGNTLRPWGGYKGKSNTYNVSESAVDAARAEVQHQNLGDLGFGAETGGYAGGGGGGGNMAVTHQPITFQNTFNVSVSGGGQGTDVSNMVRQIASRLENQMQRVQATRR